MTKRVYIFITLEKVVVIIFWSGFLKSLPNKKYLSWNSGTAWTAAWDSYGNTENPQEALVLMWKKSEFLLKKVKPAFYSDLNNSLPNTTFLS